MLNYRRTIIAFLVFILVLLLFIYGKVQGSRVVVYVEKGVAARGTVEKLVSAFGVVKSKKVDLSFAPSALVGAGKLAWLGAKEGDQVKAGQQLARLSTYPEAKAEFESATKLYKAGILSRNAYDQAKAKLDYFVIIAPFDGVITSRHLEIGEVVGTFMSSPVLTLEDLAHSWVEVDVDESDISKIIKGQTVKIYSDSFPHEIFKGKVEFVSRSAEYKSPLKQTNITAEDSKAFRARIRLLDGKDKLQPGMSVNVDIVTMAKPNVVLVPREAIYNDENGKDIVFVIHRNRIRIKPVSVGIKETNNAEILSGIEIGEVVAVSNLDKLRQGTHVWVKK